MKSVKVRVPATTANLGPGFDCLGMALNLFSTVEAREDDRLSIEATGEGSGLYPVNESNLTAQAMRHAYEVAGRTSKGFAIRLHNAIPLSRGLGSSAAAIVGGLVAADALMGGPLGHQETLKLACVMEGHPDNVTPCLLGGLTASCMDGKEVHYVRTVPDHRFAFAAMVPDFHLPTKQARMALPDVYPKADALCNVSGAVLTFAALEKGLSDVLKTACRDRLHEPYRKALVPGWAIAHDAANETGALAVFLSGAGPTLMAVYEALDDDFCARLRARLGAVLPAWKTYELSCCQPGAVIIE